MKTKVTLREENRKVEVSITSSNKPNVDELIMEKWQNIIDLIADIFGVPAGLIMKITNTNMEVFLRSRNKENPYPEDGKDTLGHGLYCETVIGKDQELLVPNALENTAWENNPDVALNMISYYGLPLQWSDQSFFGTICVLDDKPNHYTRKYKLLLKQMKASIEADLKMLELKKELEDASNFDYLTGVCNRRCFTTNISKWIDAYYQKQIPFTLVMYDFDKFKRVNDEYGHLVGDQVLKKVTQIIEDVIDKDDIIARFGGDEFIVGIQHKSFDEVKTIVKKAKAIIRENDFLNKHGVEISYGLSSMDDTIQNEAELIKIVDDKMLEIKRWKKEKENE